ncbi:MAG: hypothetical protein NZ764_00235, partial [Marinobacter nauticus]|nr:hypothetical protein [Marinobacter nauticus]
MAHSNNELCGLIATWFSFAATFNKKADHVSMAGFFTGLVNPVYLNSRLPDNPSFSRISRRRRKAS